MNLLLSQPAFELPQNLRRINDVHFNEIALDRVGIPAFLNLAGSRLEGTARLQHPRHL
jgi:hypothetical protein